MFTGWEHIFSYPVWIAAVFSPPAASSSGSVFVDKTEPQPIGEQMNEEVMWTKRSSGR